MVSFIENAPLHTHEPKPRLLAPRNTIHLENQWLMS
jgi:hypothetical protein